MNMNENFSSVDSGLARLPQVVRLIEMALDEDLGRGDVTTECVVWERDRLGHGDIRAREPLVVFGLDVAAAVFHRVDATTLTSKLVGDGVRVEAGASVLAIRGPSSSILKAERTALNFLQRLSGIATQSRRFADAVAGTRARVVDTRKTTPGYRVLEKAAVLAGGCSNHRFDLGSGILIKDNHIAACGSVTTAIERARVRAPHCLRIEVEVDTLEQLDEALEAGADAVLLDNMSAAQVKEAARRAHLRGALVEVSGGVSLKTVRSYAEADADVISAGALTHSAASVDLGLDMHIPGDA